MYTSADRQKLADTICKFVQQTPEFEGLLQIGSGAVGYTDIYSDIDLMAGILGRKNVCSADEKLSSFFAELGAVWIDHRMWSDFVLGLSVYFENGLSVDFSYMPTKEIALRSPYFKILFSKSASFEQRVYEQSIYLVEKAKQYGIDNSIQHSFFYALRKCEIALLRRDFIYADMALSEARQCLLQIEVVKEHKKLHQFKAFHTLDGDFLKKLEYTYPASRNTEGLSRAKECLLDQYQNVVKQCNFLEFEEAQLKILKCFQEEIVP